jgi:hypothetical protein
MGKPMSLSAKLGRSIAIAVALLCGVASAQANTMDNYDDLVRPDGHSRSDAVFQADLNSCYSQTGASRYRQDTAAFRQCMLGRNWRWTSVRVTRTRPGSGSGQAPDWTYRGCVFNPADC